jgi:hypothetical protein
MMHHGMLFQHLSSKSHAMDKHGRAERPCFAGKSWRHVKQMSMEMTQSKDIKWNDQKCK